MVGEPRLVASEPVSPVKVVTATGRPAMARLFAALLPLLVVQAHGFGIETVLTVAEPILMATDLAKTVLKDVLEGWQIIDKLPFRSRNNFDAASKHLLSLEGEVRRLQDIQRETNSISMLETTSKMWRNTRLELSLHELAVLLEKVDTAHRTMIDFSQNIDKLENSTVQSFAEACVSFQPGSLQQVLARIHSLATPTGDSHGLIQRGIIFDLIKAMKDSDMHMCEMQQSQKQLMYNFYNTIILAEVKGFSVLESSWMLLKLFGKGNFTHERKMSKLRYERGIAETITTAKQALAEAKSVIWRCDPAKFVEGGPNGSYTQLTRLLQGYIENEVDLNDDNTCSETCGYYSYAKSSGCYKDEFCSNQPSCTGTILWCHFVESDMRLCLAPRNSNRRYEYIRYETSTYGAMTNCQKGESNIKSWSRWLFWRCNYCLCICDQSGPLSDRYFSLKESLSDVSMNKVIVGLRFIKEKRVIHLQISEGVLLPGGMIDHKTVTWKQVPTIDLRKSAKGVDFHEMSVDERIVDLDDLHAAKEYVVTGVKFKKIGAHLNFEIRTTPFDFVTGQLNDGKSEWISNDNTAASPNPRFEHRMLSPDIPTKTTRPSEPMSNHDQFVKFTHSDYVKDAAQTTIPFIDTQPVVSNVPVPLTGAGIYHKGHEGYGGFLAPRIYTYDYLPHVSVMEYEAKEEAIVSSSEDDISDNDVIEDLTKVPFVFNDSFN